MMKPTPLRFETLALAMGLATVVGLGCESFDSPIEDSAWAAHASSSGELTYLEWERRPQSLWNERVEAPSLILFEGLNAETGRVQLMVFGVDAGRGVAEFALIASPEQYGEVMVVATEQGLNNGISSVGVPKGDLGPVSPGGGPGGNPSERLVKHLVTFAKKQHLLAKEFAAGFPED